MLVDAPDVGEGAGASAAMAEEAMITTAATAKRLFFNMASIFSKSVLVKLQVWRTNLIDWLVACLRDDEWMERWRVFYS